MKESNSNDSMAVLGLKTILGLSVGDLNLRPNYENNTKKNNVVKKPKTKTSKNKKEKSNNDEPQIFDDASEALKAILLSNKKPQIVEKKVKKKQTVNNDKKKSNETSKSDYEKLTKASMKYFATASLFASVPASKVPQPVFDDEDTI